MTDSNDIGSDYEALVRQATGHGLQGLDCTLVQLPSDQNGHHGIVVAAATTERGVFRAVGEAWRDLLPSARRGETLTVAEMNAKSRALREALGMPAVPASRPIAAPAAPTDGRTVSQAAAEPQSGGPRAAAIGSGPLESTAASSGPRSNGSRPATGLPGGPSGAGGAGPRSDFGSGPAAHLTRADPVASALEREAGIAEGRDATKSDTSAKHGRVLIDGLGTDMISQLLEMTKKKAAAEGNPAGDEEAMKRLDSYFQRAFGHPLTEASSVEGRRVIQRLAADLQRAGAGQAKGVTG